MRIYIIGHDGITLSREAPATMTEGEIAVAQRRNCMPPRSVANGFWHCGTRSRVSRSRRRSVTAIR
jgi:hypothetical protein